MATTFSAPTSSVRSPRISDVDTATILRADPTLDQLTALGRLHEKIVEDVPGWEDRVEVVYLSSRALATFRTASSPAARISPGEPFHAIEVDHRWLIDWYQLRQIGIALRGPRLSALMPDITRSEAALAVTGSRPDPARVPAGSLDLRP